MTDVLKKRRARFYQAKHRGSTSRETELENALLILCWEGEQLSEGQLSKMLDLDRVSIRKMRHDFLDRGMKIAEALDGRP